MTDLNAARARTYSGLLNGSNEAEREFLRVLPLAVRYVNDQLRTRGYDFALTPAELTMNFITEGGFFPLNDNYTTGINAFETLGVDNFAGAIQVYRHWVTDELARLGTDPRARSCNINEQGNKVCTVTNLTLEQALMLSSGIFGYFAAAASRDITGYAELPVGARYFWTTIYFNAGEPTARRLYRKYGVEYYQRGWEGPANNMVARFNALWRMRSHDRLLQQLPNFNAAHAPGAP